MLNNARYRLSQTPRAAKFDTTGLAPAVAAATAASTTANTTLLAGPASATSAKPFRPPQSLEGFVFTGLPHPRNPAPISDVTAGSSTVPIQSTCANGLSVTRPSRSGVSSPNLVATQACANSCGVVSSHSNATLIRAASKFILGKP